MIDARLDASRLESLLESAKVLGSSLKIEDQLSHLARTIMGRLLVTRCVIAVGETVLISRGAPLAPAGAPFPADPGACGLASVHRIGLAEEPQGWLGLGRPAGGALGPGERDFLEALLALAATSIANARAHQQVLARNQELRALLDLARGIAAAIEPEDIARLLMLTLAGRYALRTHALFTWSEGHSNLVRVRGLTQLDPADVRARLGDRAEPLIEDGLAVFPIRTGESTSGAVVLGPRATGEAYTPGDLEFIASLVAQAAVALDNAWRFEDTLYRQHLEEELTLAASIQKDLFPSELPVLEHTVSAARNRQAREVGGDYYDALPVGARGAGAPHLFTVADISGKGVGASLLMANIQATLRAVLASESALTVVASRTSDLLYASTPGSKYATAIMVQYDPLNGACEYVNGGHNEGVLLRAGGEVELLKATGLPVGLLPKRTFDSARFAMNRGDLLLIYTDGVPEACTRDNEEFGLDRTIECLREVRHEAPEVILDHLFSEIDRFAAGAPQHDDITALVLKRTGEA
jgi:phosphoserine phosphatase RsbU/P